MTGPATYRDVAVVVPCHNEETTVADVVADFAAALPGALVVVVDNDSDDATAAVARAAGAFVISEPRRGKGRAVRRLFSDIDASCYVLIDGDGTYDPKAAPGLVRLVMDEGVDMVVGSRVSAPSDAAAYRRGHQLGNAVLTYIFQRLFRLPLNDTLSGYRVLSRRFVKSFPTGATGFEIEVELNAHAAVLEVPVAEVATDYSARPPGSVSKLDTYADGWRILRRNLRLFRDARPTLAFTLLASPLLAVSTVLIGVAVLEFIHTGLVNHFPSLIAGVGGFLVGTNFFIAGLVMERIARNRIEVIRLAYLSHPSLLGERVAEHAASAIGSEPGSRPALP
jgi:glycosyltransferase involved in cell wall biosynthesis